MKLILSLILTFGVVAFAEDYGGDPNMDIGLNPGTTMEGTHSDFTKAQQNSQRSYGIVNVANCPFCNQPTQRQVQVEPEVSTTVDSSGNVTSIDVIGGTPVQGKSESNSDKSNQ